jgi:hypothetical protein
MDGMLVYPVLPTLRWKRLERPSLGYVTLAEALDSGQCEAREAPSAHVPELVMWNGGPSMVLALDGDELVGGKQNRCLNSAVLLPGERETTVPVSCVERRRWHGSANHFSHGHSMSHGLRARSHGHVSAHLRGRSGHVSNQHDIWDAIQQAQVRHGVQSPTASMHDVYESGRDRLQRFATAFPPHAQAVGMVVGIGERVVGADLFDCVSTAQRYWARLIQSYAQRALDERVTHTTLSTRRYQASMFLERAACSEGQTFASPGVGQDFRLAGTDGVSGSALAWEGRVVHMGLFAKEGQP